MHDHFYFARKMLQVHEGLRLTEYKDTTGNKTIGYGWNLDAKPLPSGIGKKQGDKMVISAIEAEALLDVSMLDHWNELVSALPWVNDLNAWRQAVLLDMAFNMGVPTLLTFKNTLSLITAGDYDGASRLMLKSKWAEQVKRRADVLSEVMRLGFMPAALMAIYKIDLSGG
jgi:lysozyme